MRQVAAAALLLLLLLLYRLLPVAHLLAALRNGHGAEPEPRALLIKLINLTALSVMQEPDSLSPLLQELTTLLLHLLSKQSPPHAHPLLKLPPLSRPLAFSRHSALALVGCEYLQLSLQLLGQLGGLQLLALVQPDRLLL